MREILSYFFSPENSMAQLVASSDNQKIKSGIKYWLAAIILLELFTMAIYRAMGLSIESLMMQLLLLPSAIRDMANENITWLIVSGYMILRTLLHAILKCGIWTLLLWVASKLLKDTIDLKIILTITVYAILNWLAVQYIDVGAYLIANICPINLINEIAEGIAAIANYWYLILIILGYVSINKENFFKGAIIVLVIQCILWGICDIAPGFMSFLA